MIQKQVSFLIMATGFVGYINAASGAAVTKIEAAELSLHRAERLIDLGKIDDTYSIKFKGLTFEALPGTIAPGQPAYRIVHQQVPNSNGTAKKLELVSDTDGKPVPNDFKMIEGGEAEKAPVWPDKSATELTEEPLHAITRLNKAEYQPFIKNLTAITLSQVTATDGSLRGLVVVTASGTTDTLETLVTEKGKTDGDPVVKKH